MKGATDSRHDFSEVLGDEHIGHLVDFLMNGVIDVALYVDYDAKQPFTFDLEHGESHFSTICALCHGADGTEINFGSEVEPEYVGTVASHIRRKAKRFLAFLLCFRKMARQLSRKSHWTSPVSPVTTTVGQQRSRQREELQNMAID